MMPPPKGRRKKRPHIARVKPLMLKAAFNERGFIQILSKSTSAPITRTATPISAGFSLRTPTHNGGDQADFYVSTVGNDAWTGTAPTDQGGGVGPFRNINRADSAVSPGNTVLVLDGTYDETVDIGTAGTSGNRITYKSQNLYGAKVNGGGTRQYGIQINASYITIDGFDIYDVGNPALGGAHAIDIQQAIASPIIRRCRARNTGNFSTGSLNSFSGIFIQAASNVLIERCLIHDNGRTNTPDNHDHGIYWVGSANGIIRNCIVYNHFAGWGIQLYPDSISNIKILNNIFDDGNVGSYVGHIIQQCQLVNCEISNNIFNQGPFSYGIAMSEQCSSGSFVRNNLSTNGINSSSPSGFTFSGNFPNGSPNFVNEGARNYHLQSGSDAIDLGLTFSEVFDDFDGNARTGTNDAGPYIF